MREQLHMRLEALRHEFETGHVELEKLERQRTHVRETLLRISGAIQVLEELLVEGHTDAQNGASLGAPPSDTTQAHEAPLQ